MSSSRDASYKFPIFSGNDHTFDRAFYSPGLLSIAYVIRPFCNASRVNLVYLWVRPEQGQGERAGRKSSRLPPQSHILALGEVGHEAIAGTSIAPPRPPELRHGHMVRDGWWGQGAPPHLDTAAELSPTFWGSDFAVPEIAGRKGRGRRRDGGSPGPEHGHRLTNH